MSGRVTLLDRCLLHLLDRAGLGPMDPAAEDLLQDRIADSLGARRAHVSRAMKRLTSRGLVRDVKIHAHGEPRRRVAYFLTDEGLRAAKRTRERVEAMSLDVVDLEGRKATRRLYEVPALLPRKPRFSDLLSAVEHGSLDLRRFLDRQAHVHRGRVHDVRGAIVTPHFRGREAALARLDEFVADRRARGLLLLGLPGIGKTAVVSRWVEGWKGRRHVFWRRLGPDTGAAETLRDLAAMLRGAGRPALSDHLHRPAEGPRDDRRLLHRDLAGLSAILVFDDAHAAEGEVADLVAGLLRINEDAADPKVVLLAREVPRFLAMEDIARGRVRREALDDLAPADADAVLASMGVQAPRRAAILARCGGHPLSLELAAAGGIRPDTARRTSAALLAETVLSRIDIADREALGLAAILENPVSVDALGAHAQRLLRQSLLRDASDGCVTVHDLVRDAVLGGLTPDRVADLHVRAANLLARGEPGEALAAIRHFATAGAFREAEALAVARGDAIIDAGLAEPFASAIEQLAWTSRGSPDGPRLGLLHGHALSALGRWRDAARAYEGCESTDARASAEALLGRGQAELHRRSRLALPLLESARDQLERFGSLRLLAEAQYWIGCVHENAGRLADAQEAFERGRAIAFDVGDRRWEGMCSYGIGRIRSREKDYRGAVEQEKEALRLLEREGHQLEIAKVCAGLGGNLMYYGPAEEAESYLDRAAREARGAGAIGILASTLYNLASLRIDTARFDDAAALFREASELYELQEQYEAAVKCSAWGAMCLSKRDPALAGDWFRRGETFLARVREPSARAVSLQHLARASRRAGRLQQAKRFLGRALTEAREAKLGALVEEITAERKALS